MTLCHILPEQRGWVNRITVIVSNIMPVIQTKQNIVNNNIRMKFLSTTLSEKSWITDQFFYQLFLFWKNSWFRRRMTYLFPVFAHFLEWKPINLFNLFPVSHYKLMVLRCKYFSKIPEAGRKMSWQSSASLPVN